MSSFLKGFLYFLIFTAILFAIVFGIRFARNFLLSTRATTGYENITITQITQTTAKITWTTERETQSTVFYGEEPENLPLMRFENTATKNHQLFLDLLNPATKYYFKIDNNGPWEFTTLASVESPAEFDPAQFEEKYGSSDPLYDLNHDGIVNSTDYTLYLQSQ